MAQLLANYIVLPEKSLAVIAAWVLAAWLADEWAKFPHLSITSPEKRCGKTTLLDLLVLIVPRPRLTSSISPAAVYRVVNKEKPTLLIDEAQILNRRDSETGKVLQEILNAGIEKNAKVTRCGSAQTNFDPVDFYVYGPKIFAMIGEPEGVLADRCLSVRMRRKTANETYAVDHYRSREVEPKAKKLRAFIKLWADKHREAVREVYQHQEHFQIGNDRLADLLLPLQAVLEATGGGRPLDLLEEYARELDDREDDITRMSPGVRLLAACREIFSKVKENKKNGRFLSTIDLIRELVDRDEEPWAHFVRGNPLTSEALANLLRPYGVRSGRNHDQTARGYCASSFAEAWEHYLPTSPQTPRKPV